MEPFAARMLRSGFAVSLVVIVAVLMFEDRKSRATAVHESPMPSPSTDGPSRVAAECSAEPMPTRGVTYVCDCGPGASAGCRPGDDGAHGRDPEHALRSIEAAARVLGTMPAGGTVALCRGGSFPVARRVDVANFSCRSDAPCTLRDFAPAGASWLPPPRIVATHDALAFEDAGPANRDGGYRVENLDIVGQRAGTGILVANDVEDLDVCNVTLRGFQIGMHVTGSDAIDHEGVEGPASDGRSRDVRLRGSRVEANYDIGFLGSCVGCVVEANVFRGNATAGTVLNHAIDFDGDGSDERIAGNVLLENGHDRRGHCNGVVIVVHGRHDGMTIADNSIHERLGAADATCWGIALGPGEAASPAAFARLSVRGNRIDDVGNVAIGLTACADCTVEGNAIRQGNAFEATGIEAPDRPRGAADARLARLAIRDNRIAFRGQAVGVGIHVGEEGTGHVVRGNTIVHRGRGAFACLDVPGSRVDASGNRCTGGSPRPATNRDARE